jgi:hypothetical protein
MRVREKRRQRKRDADKDRRLERARGRLTQRAGWDAGEGGRETEKKAC